MIVKEFYLEWKRLKFLKTELFHKQSPIMRKVILEKDIILENLANPLFEVIKYHFFVHYKKLLEICREKNDIEYNNVVVEQLYHEIVSSNSRYNEFETKN